jgi:hypothetical protein
MELLMGMAGVLLSAGIFLLGLCLGGLFREERPGCSVEERNAEEIEQERRRLIEEQEAFRMQMEYNADVAYGMSGTEERYR